MHLFHYMIQFEIFFQNLTIAPDKIDLDAMRADYEKMKEQKDASMKTYAEFNADAKKLEKLTETLERYLEREDRNRTRTAGNDTLS